jgi:endoglycosylceramidase
MIWYEPLTMFNEGVPTSMVVPPDRRLGFAFHDYSLCNCTVEDALVVSNAVAHSKTSGSALLQTEFGATFDTAVIGRQLALYDRRRIPWMFWSYPSYVVPYAADGALVPATDANVNHTMLGALARPYPQLVAGTPTGWRYDPTTNTFTFRYTSDRLLGRGRFPAGAATDIAVPAITYPTGYVATVAGGTIASAPDAPILRVRSTRRAVAVSIRPR